MRVRLTWLIWMMAGVTLTALAGGCSTVDNRRLELDVPEGVRLLAMDIENFQGSVEIRTDERKRTEEGVIIKGRVRTGSWPNGDDKRAANESVTIEATIDEHDGRGVLIVRSSTTDPMAGHAVDLVIFAPRCDGLRVLNEGGDVEAVGTAGQTHIENKFGAIEMRTRVPVTEDVTLLTVDGNVYCQTAFGSTGAIDMETLDGDAILRDFSGDSDEAWSSAGVLQAVLSNNADNRILARTNRGDVRLWVMEEPEALTRSYRGKIVDPRDSMYLKGSRRHTRNLPDAE